MIAAVTTTIYKLVEWLLMGSVSHAYIILPTILFTVAIHIYFRKTKNIDISAYAATIILMVAYVYVLRTTVRQDYTILYWSIPIPIIPFFYFETKKALVVILLFYLFTIGDLILNLEAVLNSDFGIFGIMNYFGAVLLTSLLVIDLEWRRLDLIGILRDKTDELEFISMTDKLTGLYNRVKLDEALALEIDRSHRSQEPLSVIILNLDHFKHVNDHYEHLVGDEVLQALPIF